VFIRTQSNGSRTYLLIVNSERVDGKVIQRVLFRLGRLDQLLASGQLDSLVQSLGRFSEKLAVLGTHARGDSIATRSARIGPALIFERLWQACSIDKVLTALLEGRRFEFSVERAILLTVLHRLLAPGSDCVAEKWKDDCAIEGVAGLDSHHLYGPWPGWERFLPRISRMGLCHFLPAPIRTSSRKRCLLGVVTCSPTWTSCSSTPHRSTSTGREARPSAGMDTQKIIVPTGLEDPAD
jgi:hypothetical protein